ncbi:MAG: hypothetical protein MJZ74_03765 [Muribaculaceae bacterium]|nr:hypothetical protein [Muribaculaceae bacterium]
MTKKLFTLIVLAIFTLNASTNAYAAGKVKLPQQDVYKIMNTYTHTWVKLQYSMLADITGTEADASDLYVAYKTQENGEAVLTNLSGDGGDMIETLDMIKGLIEEVLEYYNKPTWFLNQMFELHLVDTGDGDGSVFLCVDVPAIEGWDEIKEIILDAANGQTAVTYYITHMVPGNRHYMRVDPDGSFGYGIEQGPTVKWQMNLVAYPQSGFFYTKNVATDNSLRVVDEGFTTDFTTTAARSNQAGAVFHINIDENGYVTRLRSQGEDLAAAVAELANATSNDTYLRLNHTNTSADKFDHNTFTLKLHVADTQIDGQLMQQLASNPIVKMMAAAGMTLEADKDYYISVKDGALAMSEIDLTSDNTKWKLDAIDSQENYFAPTLSVVGDEASYRTLYTDFAYEVVNPANVNIYAVESIDEDGVATLVPIRGIIPARTAVVMIASDNSAANCMLQPVASDTEYRSNNMLQGVFFDNKQAVDEYTYQVATDGTNPIFLPNLSNYVPGNEAWLYYESEEDEPIVIVIDDKRTGIDGIAAGKKDGAIYDLMGRKVLNPTQGIYIQNGKKFIVK